MGLSASQGRLLLLTARQSDLEFRAQQISQKRLVLSQQLEEISKEYEEATSNRQMKINLFLQGANDSDKKTSVPKNLTYAALISGTLGMYTSEQSGIQSYSRTKNQEYSSTTAYRLTDASGAIVVSSLEEIPGTISKSTQTEPTAKEGYNNYYTVETTVKKEKAAEQEAIQHYIVAPQGSALASLSKNTEFDIDAENGLLKTKVGDTNNFVYYDIKTGEEVTDQSKISNFKSSKGDNDLISVVAEAKEMEKGTIKSIENVNYEGSDDKYTLFDKDGRIIARYVVDPSLKYGTTDIAGTNSGPNYLQDCLRNGKYLLEKGGLSEEDSTKIIWSSISWDATTNISDSYYTEDDDTAKAKYDRLQSQIQSQDKKLELELDNIESQRSAVKTESESVEKVINDNIDKSFKTFNA